MEAALRHFADGGAAGRARNVSYNAAVGLAFAWQRLGQVVIGDGRCSAQWTIRICARGGKNVFYYIVESEPPGCVFERTASWSAHCLCRRSVRGVVAFYDIFVGSSMTDHTPPDSEVSIGARRPEVSPSLTQAGCPPTISRPSLSQRGSTASHGADSRRTGTSAANALSSTSKNPIDGYRQDPLDSHRDANQRPPPRGGAESSSTPCGPNWSPPNRDASGAHAPARAADTTTRTIQEPAGPPGDATQPLQPAPAASTTPRATGDEPLAPLPEFGASRGRQSVGISAPPSTAPFSGRRASSPATSMQPATSARLGAQLGGEHDADLYQIYRPNTDARNRPSLMADARGRPAPAEVSGGGAPGSVPGEPLDPQPGLRALVPRPTGVAALDEKDGVMVPSEPDDAAAARGRLALGAAGQGEVHQAGQGGDDDDEGGARRLQFRSPQEQDLERREHEVLEKQRRVEDILAAAKFEAECHQEERDNMEQCLDEARQREEKSQEEVELRQDAIDQLCGKVELERRALAEERERAAKENNEASRKIEEQAQAVADELEWGLQQLEDKKARARADLEEERRQIDLEAGRVSARAAEAARDSERAHAAVQEADDHRQRQQHDLEAREQALDAQSQAERERLKRYDDMHCAGGAREDSSPSPSEPQPRGSVGEASPAETTATARRATPVPPDPWPLTGEKRVRGCRDSEKQAEDAARRSGGATGNVYAQATAGEKRNVPPTATKCRCEGCTNYVLIGDEESGDAETGLCNRCGEPFCESHRAADSHGRPCFPTPQQRDEPESSGPGGYGASRGGSSRGAGESSANGGGEETRASRPRPAGRTQSIQTDNDKRRAAMESMIAAEIEKNDVAAREKQVEEAARATAEAEAARSEVPGGSFQEISEHGLAAGPEHGRKYGSFIAMWCGHPLSEQARRVLRAQCNGDLTVLMQVEPAAGLAYVMDVLVGPFAKELLELAHSAVEILPDRDMVGYLQLRARHEQGGYGGHRASVIRESTLLAEAQPPKDVLQRPGMEVFERTLKVVLLRPPDAVGDRIGARVFIVAQNIDQYRQALKRQQARQRTVPDLITNSVFENSLSIMSGETEVESRVRVQRDWMKTWRMGLYKMAKTFLVSEGGDVQVLLSQLRARFAKGDGHAQMEYECAEMERLGCTGLAEWPLAMLEVLWFLLDKAVDTSGSSCERNHNDINFRAIVGRPPSFSIASFLASLLQAFRDKVGLQDLHEWQILSNDNNAKGIDWRDPYLEKVKDCLKRDGRGVLMEERLASVLAFSNGVTHQRNKWGEGRLPIKQLGLAGLAAKHLLPDEQNRLSMSALAEEERRTPSATNAYDRNEEATPRRHPGPQYPSSRILFASGAAEAPASHATGGAGVTPHRDTEGRFTDPVVREAHQALVNSSDASGRSNARTLQMLADSPISADDLRTRVNALIASSSPGQPPVFGAQPERRSEGLAASPSYELDAAVERAAAMERKMAQMLVDTRNEQARMRSDFTDRLRITEAAATSGAQAPRASSGAVPHSYQEHRAPGADAVDRLAREREPGADRFNQQMPPRTDASRPNRNRESSFPADGGAFRNFAGEDVKQLELRNFEPKTVYELLYPTAKGSSEDRQIVPLTNKGNPRNMTVGPPRHDLGCPSEGGWTNWAWLRNAKFNFPKFLVAIWENLLKLMPPSVWPADSTCMAVARVEPGWSYNTQAEDADTSCKYCAYRPKADEGSPESHAEHPDNWRYGSRDGGNHSPQACLALRRCMCEPGVDMPNGQPGPSMEACTELWQFLWTRNPEQMLQDVARKRHNDAKYSSAGRGKGDGGRGYGGRGAGRGGT